MGYMFIAFVILGKKSASQSFKTICGKGAFIEKQTKISVST